MHKDFYELKQQLDSKLEKLQLSNSQITWQYDYARGLSCIVSVEKIEKAVIDITETSEVFLLTIDGKYNAQQTAYDLDAKFELVQDYVHYIDLYLSGAYYLINLKKGKKFIPYILCLKDKGDVAKLHAPVKNKTLKLLSGYKYENPGAI